MAQITAKSILDRDGDTKLYTVFVGVSTIRLYWDQMTDRQRLMQIQYEREAEARALHVVLNNPCGLP